MYFTPLNAALNTAGAMMKNATWIAKRTARRQRMARWRPSAFDFGLRWPAIACAKPGAAFAEGVWASGDATPWGAVSLADASAAMAATSSEDAALALLSSMVFSTIYDTSPSGAWPALLFCKASVTPFKMPADVNVAPDTTSTAEVFAFTTSAKSRRV